MLKYLFFILSLMLICFNYWMVIFSMLIFFLLFSLSSMNLFLINNVISWLGMDVLSMSMIFLTVWICFLMLLTSMEIFKKNNFFCFYMINFMLLFLFLVLTFISMDLFIFYFFFESSMLPVLFLIVGWGYQPERIQAGVYLIFYTLFASLPLMMSIFFIFKNNYSMFFWFNLSIYSGILYLFMILSFLVKMPMYFVHLWLPKAHVEGPVTGSMILAGVMLKLGGYGLMRVMSYLISLSLKFNIWWIVISLIGGVYVSVMCLHLMDLKLLIAYSSVVHMSLVIGGIMTLNYFGFTGSLGLMVGHGLCSSGLFYLINLIYERVGSRSLMIIKGMINLLPSLTMWWFLMLSSNIAAPPSLNLLGEISLFISILMWSKMSMVLIMLISFFSACYSIYVFSFSQHGMILKSLYFLKMINSRENLILLLHWVPLNLLILKVDYFYFWL
uniref:NADH dehydrogenase subunit 4 n=1 Tax=Potamyia chinensis TaxID=1875907 RepID=UPI002238E3B3|nr:NADH dehydrogenase subunit 4 [Potamyia chinensis]UYO79413.1 NADH dehydrogenase subunit 4 [Potamyia chinensis]